MLSLRDLYQKLIVDAGENCSFSQFTHYVPDTIIKPKPEDWDTCLCMPCLNTELKLECIKKILPDIHLTFIDLLKEEKKVRSKNYITKSKRANVILNT